MEKKNRSAKSNFDFSNMFVVAIDENEIVMDINEKALAFLGYKRNEIKGKNWFDILVPESDRKRAKLFFRNMLTSPVQHVHYEHSVVTKQGEKRTLCVHSLHLSDKNGKVTGVICTANDVTEHKQEKKVIEKVEDRLQTSLDNIIEGCQIIDFDWRYVYANKASTKQLHKRKEQFLGRTIMKVFPGVEKTEFFKSLKNCLENRVSLEMEYEFIFSDGSKNWFEVRMDPVPEGAMVLFSDITVCKKNEGELNKYRIRLEQAVAQRTAQCAKMNEELLRKGQQIKKTEQALKLTTTILDSAREMIFVASAKGDLLYANASATIAYGYSLDEFLNMNILKLMRPKEASSINALLSGVTEKMQSNPEMIHVRKDSTTMKVKVFSNLVKTAHGEYIIFDILKLT